MGRTAGKPEREMVGRLPNAWDLCIYVYAFSREKNCCSVCSYTYIAIWYNIYIFVYRLYSTCLLNSTLLFIFSMQSNKKVFFSLFFSLLARSPTDLFYSSAFLFFFFFWWWRLRLRIRRQEGEDDVPVSQANKKIL